MEGVYRRLARLRASSSSLQLSIFYDIELEVLAVLEAGGVGCIERRSAGGEGVKKLTALRPAALANQSHIRYALRKVGFPKLRRMISNASPYLGPWDS